MSGFTLSPGRPTLIDRVVRQSFATDLGVVAAGAALTSIAAQFTIPLWPVPLTGETFAVLLVGSSLGAVRGALALSLYLMMGTLGLPVFAGGHSQDVLNSPNGGFFIGFIFAAALTGWLTRRSSDGRPLGTIVSLCVGTIAIYAWGLPWLYAYLSQYAPAALQRLFGTSDAVVATLNSGLFPFIVGDTLKALLVAGALNLCWKLVRRHDPLT